MTYNPNNSREHTESLKTDNMKRMKRPTPTLCLLNNPISSMNLLQFIEISPSNPNSTPHPRSGHRAVATESDLWIWGGYHPSTNDEQLNMNNNQESHTFSELWRFNFALRKWTHESTTGDRPFATVASHAMCLFRNLAFVFGGTGYPFGHNISNELFILDLNRRHWTRCRLVNQQPEQVYGASMVIKDNHLYILCGTNRWHYNSNVYDIYLPTLHCTQIGYTYDEIEDFVEHGRYRQEVHIYDNKIFVFGGGGSTGIAFSLEYLPAFDLNTRTWSFIRANPDPVHSFPQARKFHSIFPFRQNQIIMFGGAYFDPQRGQHITIDEHLWKFNFEKLEWSKLSSLTMIKPSYFHAAAMNERGEIWTHGGVIGESTDDNNGRRITTLYKMHSRVLNLSEITWNSLLNYFSDRIELLTQPRSLSQLHIPKRFIKRIH